MCNCVEKVREQLDRGIRTHFAKPNDPVAHFNIHTTLGGQAIIGVSVYREKQMKPVETFVVAEHCPWCGERYEPVDRDVEIAKQRLEPIDTARPVKLEDL